MYILHQETVPVPHSLLLALVQPSEPIERESGDAHKQRPVQSLNSLKRKRRRPGVLLLAGSRKVLRRAGPPAQSEVHECSRDFRHVPVLEPNCALDNPRPRASGCLRPASASNRGFSRSVKMRVRRCIEIRDGERVIVAAHDVPGRGHGEVRLEQQEATGEREPGRMR